MMTFSTKCCIDISVDASSENRLVGLVVKASASRAKIPGSNPAAMGFFFRVKSYQWPKNGTQVATLPGFWRYRSGTGQPGVSIL